jgi:hypothetical protein
MTRRASVTRPRDLTNPLENSEHVTMTRPPARTIFPIGLNVKQLSEALPPRRKKCRRGSLYYCR